MQDVSVIDADGHVQESDAELEQYFDGPYKGHRRSGVFSIFPSLDGWPRGFVRGLDQVNRATAGVWIEFIEGSKIDAAVFPWNFFRGVLPPGDFLQITVIDHVLRLWIRLL